MPEFEGVAVWQEGNHGLTLNPKSIIQCEEYLGGPVMGRGC